MPETDCILPAIRPLRADEVPQFVALSHYAFSGRTPTERADDFGRKVIPERNCLVATESGQIVSQVMIYDFQVWIDGVQYPTGGLANVATVPEKTRRGHASALLRSALSWMREELGQCLSMLYPSMYPLYARLGWALADDSRTISGEPGAFRPARYLPRDPGGEVERHAARLEDIDDLEPLYRAFARERSGYLQRPRWYWEDPVLRIGRDDPRWVALWRDGSGQPGGYLLYTLTRTPEIGLNAREVVALRPEAYHDLLTFLSAHHLWNRVSIRAGRDVPWRGMVANPHLVSVDVRDPRNFMLRIVDLPAAFARRPARLDAKPVVIQVRDPDAPWNDGVWRLAPEDGSWRAERADAPPVATIDIANLSAMFDGFLSVSGARESGALRTDDAIAPALEALLATRYPPTCRDHF